MTDTTKRPRGRPPGSGRSVSETRDLLIRSGLEVLTEQGFSATGIDQVLRRVKVPKGSFYHFFASKEDYILAVIEAYGRYFEQRLTRALQVDHLNAVDQLALFVEQAATGMQKHDYQRGCLVGNLGQEIGQLPESMRLPLQQTLRSWEQRVEECFRRGQAQGVVSPDLNVEDVAQLFWIGWEGAVMRARLDRSDKPLRQYWHWFKQSVQC